MKFHACVLGLMAILAYASPVAADPSFGDALVQHGPYEGTWSSDTRSGKVILHFAKGADGGVTATLGRKHLPLKDVAIGDGTLTFVRVNSKGRRFSYALKAEKDGALSGTIEGEKSDGSGTFVNTVSVRPSR